MANQDNTDRARAFKEAREELVRELHSQVRPHWNIDFGKLQIPVPLASTGLSWVYVGLDMIAFGFGIACIFIGSSWRELGIALVVGAMFGISTFVGQLLAVQLSAEEHQIDLLWRDALTQKYAARLADIEEQFGPLGPGSR
jgi:hypothetical protein